jgi:hypothetical protein
MKIFELAGSKIDPLLIEFWKQANPMQLNYYFVQDNCYGASQDFISFLENKGIGNAEIVPIGRVSNGKKQYGWFHADEPDLHIDALETKDKQAMKQLGLDPRKKSDRIKYINSDPEIREDFKWIPHSWVELRGQILDPSGFYFDGKSGQFDRMVNDKSNLSSRYRFFS